VGNRRLGKEVKMRNNSFYRKMSTNETLKHPTKKKEKGPYT
jgi:hypothetical protein